MTEACEIEHGLACAYLFAAFSLKKTIPEGLSGDQVQKTTNDWAHPIYVVAGHEMLHLAQAWNLLNAVGGTPYYGRPNFPLAARYYDFNLPVELLPFSVETMQRFVQYEQPADFAAKEMLKKEMGMQPVPSGDYQTVAELYGKIRNHIFAIPESELFLGDPARQVDERQVDFPDLVCVFDRASAEKAIALIIKQGEGTTADHLSSHYGAFLTIFNGLTAALQNDPKFEPARPVVRNPSANERDDQGTRPGVTFIKDEKTRRAARYFDATYSLMLRSLGYVFSDGAGHRELQQRLSDLALRLMMQVVVPFGNALAQMPAGVDGKNAGPTFGLSRHIVLPASPRCTEILVAERLAEIRGGLADVIRVTGTAAPADLVVAQNGLKTLAAEWP